MHHHRTVTRRELAIGSAYLVDGIAEEFSNEHQGGMIGYDIERVWDGISVLVFWGWVEGVDFGDDW
jgi:hypothetical protein